MIWGPELQRARNTALTLIKQLGIERPQEIQLELIAWKAFGSLVVERDITGCDARVNRAEKRSLIVINKRSSPNRKKFSLAHEIGHLALHPEVNQLALCTIKLLFYRVRPEEREADVFASELLMPEPLFQPLCDQDEPSFDLIENLQHIFQTSLTSTAIRYIDLCPYPCALVASKNGSIVWSHYHRPSFRYPVREGKLDKNSYAADFFLNRGAATEDVKVNLATRWLEGCQNDELLVREQTREVGQYGVLTLLWTKEEDDW